MTRTVWWVIPLVWLPVASFFVSSSEMAGLPPCHVAAAVVGGVFLWTLMEYCLHRFLFHMKTTSYWSVVIISLIYVHPRSKNKVIQLFSDNLEKKIVTGETHFIISSTAAITSTQWMASASSFLLQQQQF